MQGAVHSLLQFLIKTEIAFVAKHWYVTVVNFAAKINNDIMKLWSGIFS